MPDADVAKTLAGMQLTERLSASRLATLEAALPGDKSQQQLLILADQSAFLSPPDDEIAQDPNPNAAATRQMLVQLVNYVNTTLRQLPNLMATRDTTAFEDRPEQDIQEATAFVSLSYLPVHYVGESSVVVTFRDRKEVIDEAATKAIKHGSKTGGLATTGEFGPILSTVLGDAIKGKITWARWEHGTGGTLAVFHYSVPDDKSNYRVQFCCIVNGYDSSGQSEQTVFDERAAYHGEIVFNPTDGSILRITVEAEMAPKGLVANAGIAIDYAPTEIAGRSYICPSKSVSLLLAHTAQQKGMQARSHYQGQAKTYLNDLVFTHYHRFGSEVHLLPADTTAQQ
jgi:hypothetical protein